MISIKIFIYDIESCKIVIYNIVLYDIKYDIDCIVIFFPIKLYDTMLSYVYCTIIVPYDTVNMIYHI